MDRAAEIKDGLYRRIRQQLAGELAKCQDPLARMATCVALLHHKLPHFFWTGFYRLVQGRLVVGPYQGTLACQVIELGRGVCGAALERGETLVVPDVHAFEGHIACDARTRSEIVVPYRDGDGRLAGVLDVDATEPAAFDRLDAEHLEAVLLMVFPQPPPGNSGVTS
jgi:GAF domain-containing protein